MGEMLTKDAVPMPLYYQLFESLKNKIKNGEYPVGSSIPGEFQLIKMYGVSRGTVVKAIGQLVNEGYLRRVHGKGTFVTKPNPGLHADEMVGIAMRTTHGHLYGPLSGKIIRNLEEHQRYCVMVEARESGGDNSKLISLIEKNPEVLIVDGSSSFPFEILDGYAGRIIYLYTYEGFDNARGDFVLSDYYRGGRLVVEYFISLGFDRIISITHKIREKHKAKKSFLTGAAEVIKENGLPEESLVYFPHKTDEDKIARMLETEKKPVGVLCNEDSTARHVYNAARALGLDIPRDVSVMGYYNTPWCEVFYPKLTSVSIGEEKIADIVVDKIINGGGSREKILVEPKIVERDSTCPRDSAGGAKQEV